MTRFHRLLAMVLLLAAAQAQAALNVFACEPEWGALVRELAGDQATVFVATQARQNPHHIEARPALIAQMRRADLVVCTGLELEEGWLPLLLQRSANAAVQPGQPGYFEAGSYVKRLDLPSRLDRSDGDVHAAGNPHIQLDARHMLPVAAALAQRLAQLDPGRREFYQARAADFARRWNEALRRWEQKAAPLKGVAVVSHHRDMSYLLAWLGMKSVGTLEPKPGVEPGSAHLQQLLQTQKRNPARLVLRAPYQDARASEWFASQAGIKAVQLPVTVGGSERAQDLFGLFDDVLQRLLEAVQ